MNRSAPVLSARPPRLYRRRRRRARLAVLTAGVLAVAAIAFLRPDTGPAAGTDAGAVAAPVGDEAAPGTSAATAVAPDAAAHPSADEAPAPTTPRFARFEDLDLYLPTAQPLVLGFHEAAIRGALAMQPQGRIIGHENTTKFDPPPDRDDGVDYIVLASRGRPQPATSAADIMMRDDEPVLAPVTGEVVGVREYLLYGRHVDFRIEIRPDARPDLRVVLIHVDGVRVQAGDRVDAGVTPLAATANRFPFGSNIDRYTEPERWPHVHLEVKFAEPLDDAGGMGAAAGDR